MPIASGLSPFLEADADRRSCVVRVDGQMDILRINPSDFCAAVAVSDVWSEHSRHGGMNTIADSTLF